MICLDTTFLIDLLRGKEEAVSLSRELDKESIVFTTEINVFEVVLGIFSNKNINQARDFEKAASLFKTLKILPLDHKASIEAGKLAGSLIMKGRQIDDNDCIAAAIAKTNGINIMVTRNERHFKETGLRVRVY